MTSLTEDKVIFELLAYSPMILKAKFALVLYSFLVFTVLLVIIC